MQRRRFSSPDYQPPAQSLFNSTPRLPAGLWDRLTWLPIKGRKKLQIISDEAEIFNHFSLQNSQWMVF